jgi:hypothetical protein
MSPKFILSGSILALAAISGGCIGRDYATSGPWAARLSHQLDGYDWARSQFIFEQQRVYPSVQERPEYLELRFHQKGSNPVDSVHWYNPLDKRGQPKYDWNVFRSEFEAASRVVARHRWIEQWKAAAKGRRIELQMLGDRSGEFYSFGTQKAVIRWRIAGLRGSPSYFVSLCGEQSDFHQDLAFGREEERAIVYSSATSGEFPKLHWLDRIYLGTWAWKGIGKTHQQYVVIKPSGTWRLHTYVEPP